LSIYFDNNASTQASENVINAMIEWLGRANSNPSSNHAAGQRAAFAIEAAKEQIANVISADLEDIILTSGATESNNLTIQGFCLGRESSSAIITTAIEHKCILESAAAMQGRGVDVSHIPVDSKGRITAAAIRQLLNQSARPRHLISVMHANNEIGTVAPIADISRAIRDSGALLHTDASQSAGKIPIDVVADGIDLLSFSAHKLYGPMGIGALYIAPGLRDQIRPIMYGGGQQDGLRPGTIPVFLAVGFGVACQIAAQRMEADALHVESLAQCFVKVMQSNGVEFELLGAPEARLPGLRSVRFIGVEGADLLDRVSSRISAATGAACSEGTMRTSHVLKAIGLSDAYARQVVRFGFGRTSTVEEAVCAAEIIASTVQHILSSA
jgi:cysteine desulfurase